jgi:hypothetical protein
MPTNQEIEQMLRDGFPFAAQWFFRYTEGHCYYLQGEGDNSVALHRHQRPEAWGARLEDSPYWTLAANEGPTPVEAIANLQQAIAQVGAFAGGAEA